MHSSPLGVRSRRGGTALLGRIGPEVYPDPKLYHNHKPSCPWIGGLVTHAVVSQAPFQSPGAVEDMAAGLGRSDRRCNPWARAGGGGCPPPRPPHGFTGGG